MEEISVQKARHSLDQLIRDVNGGTDYIIIKCKTGNGVLVSEDLWNTVTHMKASDKQVAE